MTFDRPEGAESSVGRGAGLRRALRRGALVVALAAQLASCASDTKTLIGDGGSDATPAPPPATLGAHGLAFQRLNGGLSVLSTAALATKASGSTLVVSVGRGDFSAFVAPTDNKNNGAYPQLGLSHTYTRYPSSGTALYGFANFKGGDSHVISNATPPGDEITLAAVEVLGTKVQDFKWREVLSGSPITSEQVTTTGPATLIAFWWGDAGVDNDKTATPNNGFTVIDAVLSSGALVQCAVAVKQVTAAGSYDVTWTSTPQQGAQLWLVAVQ